MKGLKIIPFFLGLIILAYIGMLFVEANHDAVTITFGSFQSKPTPLGFVVLTSILIGMIIAGVLCSIEMLALYVHNKNLKRKIAALEPKPRRDTSLAKANDLVSSHSPSDLPHS